MKEKLPSRRDFFKTAVLGSAGLYAVACSKTKRTDYSKNVKLGVATYSLRNFNREKAIEIIKQCRVDYACIKSMHLPYEDSPEKLAEGCEAFEQAGIQIVGGGVVTLKEDNDENMKKYFEYAKTCGMPLMVIAPIPQTMPRIEKFVKQYNIAVAIHNHGPEDEYFPGPKEAVEVIKDMDPRVGVCMDIGHAARTGEDVVKTVSETGKRLLDIHIKDLRDLSDRDSQCAVGEGKIPVPEIFKMLRKINYTGYVNLEYEIFPNNPLPGMKESFAYMKGVLAGLNKG